MTWVLGCPNAPGIGSLTEPVVASGVGSGASFVHQARYSERIQKCVGPTGSAGMMSGRGPGGGTYTGGTYVRGSGYIGPTGGGPGGPKPGPGGGADGPSPAGPKPGPGVGGASKGGSDSKGGGARPGDDDGVTPVLLLNEGEAGGAGGKLEPDCGFKGGNSNGGTSPN